MDNFEQLLAGAHFMDQHFTSAPLDKNVRTHFTVAAVLSTFGAEYQYILYRLPATGSRSPRIPCRQ